MTFKKGNIPWITGKHHTPEVRAIISKAQQGNTHALGHIHSPETREKIRLGHLGPKNAKWKGGVWHDKYPAEFNRLRPIIRERDSFTCQSCGLLEKDILSYPFVLDVHHIDGNKKNNRPENLISLCRQCHGGCNT